MSVGCPVQTPASDTLSAAQQTTFTDFTAPLIGLPITHAWKGHGTALFLEFGALKPGRIRPNGSAGNPSGEMGLSLTCGWRVEGKRSILCSFFTNGLPWPRLLACLAKGTVASVAISGRLPEISIGLSTGLHVVSFTVEQLSPDWAIFDRRGSESAEQGFTRWLHVQRGRLHIATSTQPSNR